MNQPLVKNCIGRKTRTSLKNILDDAETLEPEFGEPEPWDQ